MTQGLGETLRFEGDPRASEGIHMFRELSDTRGGPQGLGGKMGNRGEEQRDPQVLGDTQIYGGTKGMGGRTTGLEAGVWVWGDSGTWGEHS